MQPETNALLLEEFRAARFVQVSQPLFKKFL
jgi:hypothetical protein